MKRKWSLLNNQIVSPDHLRIKSRLCFVIGTLLAPIGCVLEAPFEHPEVGRISVAQTTGFMARDHQSMLCTIYIVK